MNTSTDRVERQVQLAAPRARVWRALTDSTEFGTWFRAVFAAPFRPGAQLSGRITYPGYEHLKFEIVIEKMDAERLFSFRWHPNAIDPARDYSAEPTTLVEFTLQDSGGGTLLTVVESGFDAIPLARRADAFKNNGNGWSAQITAIQDFLERQP